MNTYMKYAVVTILLVGALAGAKDAYAFSIVGGISWDPYQWLKASIGALDDTIASSLGFTQKVGGRSVVAYIPNDPGVVQTYTNSSGETLVVTECGNGAYVAQVTKACTSAANSCGMTGAGVITTTTSNFMSKSTSACSAKTPSDSLCPQPSDCTPTYSCNAAGTGIINSCTSGVTNCPYGCSNGVCKPAAACTTGSDCPSGSCTNGSCDGSPQAGQISTFAVVPSLVTKNSPTTIHLATAHMNTCAITGTDGETWTTLTGILPTQPITQQTIFSLHCVDGYGTSVDQSATVNIVPTFNEQ